MFAERAHTIHKYVWDFEISFSAVNWLSPSNFFVGFSYFRASLEDRHAARYFDRLPDELIWLLRRVVIALKVCTSGNFSVYFRQLSDFLSTRNLLFHITTCESAGTPSHPAGHLRFGAPLQFAQCSSLLFAPQTARLTFESLWLACAVSTNTRKKHLTKTRVVKNGRRRRRAPGVL